LARDIHGKGTNRPGKKKGGGKALSRRALMCVLSQGQDKEKKKTKKQRKARSGAKRTEGEEGRTWAVTVA